MAWAYCSHVQAPYSQDGSVWMVAYDPPTWRATQTMEGSAFNVEKCRTWEGRKSSAGAHARGGFSGTIKRCPELRPTQFLACDTIALLAGYTHTQTHTHTHTLAYYTVLVNVRVMHAPSRHYDILYYPIS